MARKIVCNCCGNEIPDELDSWCESFEMGYGSKYDTSMVEFDVCMPCMDKFIESMKINPIVEE